MSSLTQEEINLLNNKKHAIESLPREIRNDKISYMLEHCFTMYGQRKDVDAAMLSLSVLSVIENFAFLSVNEIKEAFKEYSLGKIKGIEPYGGEFTVLTLNRILTGFVEKRFGLLKSINEKKNEVDKMIEYEIKSKIEADKFEAEFIQDVKNYLNRAKTYSDIPGHLYKQLDKRNMIDIPLEAKKEIFQRAVEIEKEELRKEMYFAKEKSRVQTIKDILKSDKGTDRAKVIAGQIALFENRDKIIGL